jgi:hypothetical protein
MSAGKQELSVPVVIKLFGEAPRAGTAVISINVMQLALEVGAKAAFNRSLKSRALKGAVVVKFIPDAGRS